MNINNRNLAIELYNDSVNNYHVFQDKLNELDSMVKDGNRIDDFTNITNNPNFYIQIITNEPYSFKTIDSENNFNKADYHVMYITHPMHDSFFIILPNMEYIFGSANNVIYASSEKTYNEFFNLFPLIINYCED